MSGVPIRPPSTPIIAFTGFAVLTYGLIGLALILLGLVLARQAVVVRARRDEDGRRGGAHLRTTDLTHPQS